MCMYTSLDYIQQVCMYTSLDYITASVHVYILRLHTASVHVYILRLHTASVHVYILRLHTASVHVYYKDIYTIYTCRHKIVAIYFIIDQFLILCCYFCTRTLIFLSLLVPLRQSQYLLPLVVYCPILPYTLHQTMIGECIAI